MVDFELLECCYRQATGNVVLCHRLREFVPNSSDELIQVGLDACQVCQGRLAPDPDFFNDVLACFLYKLILQLEQSGTDAGLDPVSLEHLQTKALNGIRRAPRPAKQTSKRSRHQPGFLERCDVILNLSQSTLPAAEVSDQLRKSLVDLDQQVDVELTVHLVLPTSGISPCNDLPQNQAPRDNQERERLSRHSLVLHRVDRPLTDLQALHQVISDCQTEFVGIQTAVSYSHPLRFAESVAQLRWNGSDVFAAGVNFDNQWITPQIPVLNDQRTIPLEGVTLRRSAFIDAGGVGPLARDHDVDFFLRCRLEERAFTLFKPALVDVPTKFAPRPDVVPAAYEYRGPLLSHHGVGFPVERVACDVILPFRDQLDYVQQAAESILQQENCDLILHLVDDYSRSSTTSLFSKLQTDPRVRCYRNQSNLGQYTSFNNIIPYVQSEFIAIQDGDDLSLPQRLSYAINCLKLSNTEIFLGRMKVFGAQTELVFNQRTKTADVRGVSRLEYRTPRTPRFDRLHFATNATCVMRREMFSRLGGFTDYGQHLRNRCGLDTEFYIRAYFAQVRFYISKHIISMYRLHPASATQNSLTGFGSSVRLQNRIATEKRRDRYRAEPFQPVCYGALGRYQSFTEPLD